MKFIGKFAGIFKDWQSGKMRISFDADGLTVTQAYKLEGPLDISVEKHKEDRSDDENRYFHELCFKLAENQKVSMPYMKNRLIGSYGQPFLYADGHPLTASIESSRDREIEEDKDNHMVSIGRGFVGGKEFTHWIVMRGSHTYNTKEMARLIKGAIAECEACEIEYRTPEEIARWLELEKVQG